MNTHLKSIHEHIDNAITSFPKASLHKLADGGPTEATKALAMLNAEAAERERANKLEIDEALQKCMEPTPFAQVDGEFHKMKPTTLNAPDIKTHEAHVAIDKILNDLENASIDSALLAEQLRTLREAHETQKASLQYSNECNARQAHTITEQRDEVKRLFDALDKQRGYTEQANNECARLRDRLRTQARHDGETIRQLRVENTGLREDEKILLDYIDTLEKQLYVIEGCNRVPKDVAFSRPPEVARHTPQDQEIIERRDARVSRTFRHNHGEVFVGRCYDLDCAYNKGACGNDIHNTTS